MLHVFGANKGEAFTTNPTRRKCVRKSGRGFFKSADAILFYAQVIATLVGSIATIVLAAGGFDPVALLIATKVETVIINVPMHALTLRMSKWQ